MYDCVVIGGGPAGLTAAIYLSRYHLRVLVADDSESRAAIIPLSRNHAGYPDGIDLAPKFYPILSSLQRFWVAVFGAVAAGCGAETFRLRSTASCRGLMV